MTRRCSHCSNNGHNSRTCPTRAGGGLKLFGVMISEAGSMKRSASVGCLSHYSSSFGSTSAAYAEANPGDTSPVGDRGNDVEAGASGGGGYASDDPTHASCSSNCRNERKKGIPWTEEEHRMFLVGLQKLGKGDWRGIARNYVVSRTPTQVASHAQKYFIRQTNATRRKRRSSLFDMVPDMPVDEVSMMEEQSLLHSPLAEPEHSPLAGREKTNTIPSLDLTLDRELKPAELNTDKPTVELQENNSCSSLEPMVPAFYPAYIPVAFAFWPTNVSVPAEDRLMQEGHEVLRPTAVLPKKPIHVDELVEMSKLSLTEACMDRMEPSSLTFKLLEASSSRQSAFHSNPAVVASDFSQSSKNAIHAL